MPEVVDPAPSSEDPASHVPVMLQRCVDLLGPALQHDGAVVVDGTLGLGGHTAALLAAAPRASVVGVDRDPVALAEAGRRLAAFGDRFVAVGAVHDDVEAVLDAAGVELVDGVLLDLGVSSMQLDQDSRGFSYSRDTPLDMRMGDSGPTAADVLNTYPERLLVRIMRAHSDEKFADRIARAVVAGREREPASEPAAPSGAPGGRHRSRRRRGSPSQTRAIRRSPAPPRLAQPMLATSASISARTSSGRRSAPDSEPWCSIASSSGDTSCSASRRGSRPTSSPRA